MHDRIAKLLDESSFEEIGSINGRHATQGNSRDFIPAYVLIRKKFGDSPSDRNCVIGWGRVCDRKVFVTADDFSVRGGHADGGIQGKAAYGEVNSCSIRFATDRHLGVSFRIWLN